MDIRDYKYLVDRENDVFGVVEILASIGGAALLVIILAEIYFLAFLFS